MGGGGGGALWKSHCQLLGRGHPVSKSHGKLSFLECCCKPSCKCQADTILHKEFHQQFELHSVVRIFQIDRHGQSLFLPLEFFVDIFCQYGCVFPGVVSTALYLPWFRESTFLLSKSCASFLGTIRSTSFPVVFCIVRIRHQFAMFFPVLELA